LTLPATFAPKIASYKGSIIFSYIMKKICFLLAALPLLGVAPYTPFSGAYMPVFMSRETLENSVRYLAGGHAMIQSGKIYYIDSYIYVNERYKGVNVINNTNPAHPVKEGFILAPGCMDMAVKGNILYLDNAVDLVAFDLESRQVTHRIRDVFPEPLPPDDFSYYRLARPKGYIIVEWKKHNQ